MKKEIHKELLKIELEKIKIHYDHMERIVTNVILFSMIIVAIILVAVLKGLPLQYGLIMIGGYGIIVFAMLLLPAKRSDEVTNKDIPALIEKVRQGKL